MEALREILEHDENLVLFLVIGIGYLVGQVRVYSFRLGISAVLFVGLFFGGWCPEGKEPFSVSNEVTHIGLILFVYAVGLTSGPGFFDSMKKRGVRFNLAVAFSLMAGAILTLVVGALMQLPITQIAGVYCGGLTNTPALAAVTELVRNTQVGNPSDPAVGYSMAYPFGVLGGLISFYLFTWVFRESFDREKEKARAYAQRYATVTVANFEITNPEIIGKAIGELRVHEATGLIISRHQHGEEVVIPTKYSILREGDVVVAVGAAADIEKGEKYFGKRSKEHLEAISGPIQMRRVLVSRKSLVGKTIGELELDRRFNAQVTRHRRADVDMVADPNRILELGDRLRIVMPADKSREVAEFFGDSERGITELDYTALTLGISLGVLLGMIPIPVPGGSSVSLGFAGGPLVMGLILGKIGRTGPLVWSIPLESNEAIRHIGLLLFLGGVGIMAGGRFFQALSSNGILLVLLGFLTTTVTTWLSLLLLKYYGRGSIVSSIGATSGMQTQPATLAAAYEMSRSDETYVAYATTYPVAMVGKILIAQLMVIVGNYFLGG